MKQNRRNLIKLLGFAVSSIYLQTFAGTKSLFFSKKDLQRQPAGADNVEYDCIIIGGGIAGVTLARDLHFPSDRTQTPKKVLILEASSNLGGRISTDRKLFSHPVELGAEYVHMNAIGIPLWRELLKYKLKVWKISKLDSRVYHASSSPDKAGRLKGIIHSAISWNPFKAATVWSSFKVKKNKMDISARKFLDTKVASTGDKYEYDFKSMILTGHLGALPEDLSMRGFQSDNISAQLSYLGEYDFQNGYDTLVSSIAHKIPVRFNQTVQAISYSKDRVIVKTTDGQVYTAKTAALTTSLGVIKSGEIQFDPALPQEKINAIDSLDMSYHIKVHMEFSEQFWTTGTSMLQRPDQNRRVGKTYFMTHIGRNVKPMLTALIMGPDAKKIENMPDQEVFKNIILDLQDCFPKVKTIDELAIKNSKGEYAFTIKDWRKDPLHKGGISFIKYGFENKIAPEKVRETYANPELTPGLFWAGEAASTYTQPASVHGAHSTGARAAIEIHHYLETKSFISPEKLLKTYKKLWTEFLVGNKLTPHIPMVNYIQTTETEEELKHYSHLIEEYKY